MTTPPPISDTAVYDLIFAAREALGEGRAETVRAETAMVAARRALDLIMVALLVAAEAGDDALPGVTCPAPRQPRRPPAPPP